MPIPTPTENFGRFIVARINTEVFAVQAGENCTSYIRTSVARELGLSFRSRDASIIIEVESKVVSMVIAISPDLDQELVLGTDFLYLLDYWS